MFSAVLRPLLLAPFQGAADPPSPRSRWRAMPMPRWLGLLPFRTLDLVQVFDVLLALILFLSTYARVVQRGGWAAPAYVAALGVAIPLLLRDRRPLAAWRASLALLPAGLWVSFKLGVFYESNPYSAEMVISYLLVAYSVAVRCDRRITGAAWVISVVVMWIAFPNGVPLGSVMVGAAMLLGHNVRLRRGATERLAVEERRSQEAMGAQTVLEERARIARELHDVVAHHMSVIAIQAEAVPLKAAGDPAQLEAGLAGIRALSLEAIAELRQVLGVLRDEDGRTDTAPQPGLAQVDDLVANARAAGLSVLVKLPESLEGVPQAVGMSAYRIVQESLSNAMRHAPGATVMLDIRRDEHGVRLHVTNGPGTSPARSPGAGHGLVGMRERAALLGGTLEAGPVPVGGFQVTAVLPTGRGPS
ncbi:sensor histidine kinase [Nonomuraea sp. MCN248]|uniref:histidine kinase n=1 Tax=Nonomuraea corallina TaxID=2989783 RepID=A0ABT4S5U8_9ACTN|nr:sensor histidine kinase [Nonomuraea corallina]MDA0632581.1 sensor histidine kinase [Nonomuraea corallina]